MSNINDDGSCTLSADMTAYTIRMPPDPVGWWAIGANGYWSTQFPIYARPTDEHIKNTQELLGWKWVEGKTHEQ